MKVPGDLGGRLLAAAANRGLPDAARARLAVHAGKQVLLRIPPATAGLEIRADGSLAPGAGPYDAELTLAAAALPALINGRPPGGGVAISGDTDLAADVAQALRGIDRDIEAWLAPLTGDILAHRIGAGLQRLYAGAVDASGRLNGLLREHLAEESRLLAQPPALHAYNDAVDRLREAADRLEQRVRRLEAGRPAR